MRWLAGHIIVIALTACALVPAHGGADEAFGTRLQQAAKLNVTAPWPESQAILDELADSLDQATPEQRARFHLLNARNLALDGKLDQGIDYIESHLLDGDPPLRLRIEALSLAANLATLARRHENGFEYLREGLALEAEAEDAAARASLLNQAAYMHALAGEIATGIDYGRRAVSLAESAGDPRTECVSTQRLAYVYKRRSEPETAEQAYRNALDACNAIGDPVLVGVVEFGLGDLLREQQQYSGAESLLRRSLERLSEADYEPGINETRLGLARLRFAQGEHERARRLLESIGTHFQDSGAWDYQATVHDILARIAQDRGDPAAALHHREQELAARERFLNNERAIRLAYLQVEFDLERKDRELALLREKARVADLEAETRRQQRWLAGLIYGVIGVLVVVLILLLVHATQERRRYRHLARMDGLTGLNNHTRFFEVAGEMLERAVREDTRVTMVLADIDHFKQVNDHHGHREGDEVLQRVGARLREVFDDKGVIGRIGGEEFGVLLPGRGAGEAVELIGTFRDRLEESRADDAHIHITMSFGVACRNGENSVVELRERADQALYEAKHSGRNRTMVHS